MGRSAYARVVYGYTFPEGESFPWDAAKYDSDPRDWYRDFRGYQPLVPRSELWDDDGYCAATYTKERWDANWEHGRKWDAANPMPFDIVEFGYCDYPEIAIVVPGVGQSVEWGAQPMKDHKVDGEAVRKFQAFIDESGIDVSERELDWFLGAYYG